MANSNVTEDWKATLNLPERDARIRTADVARDDGVSFESFSLKMDLLRGIFEKGYEYPSPIQRHSIPAIMNGRDVIARAKNGTGKTAAYSIPILNSIDPSINQIQACILVPTRELAMQTSQTCIDLSKHMTDVKTMLLMGGTQLKDDLIRLSQTVHLLVGTPGRIIDLMNRGHLHLDGCRIIALDEADKLLSEELRGNVEQIIQNCASKHQILVYSATYPIVVENFIQTHLKEPFTINLMERLTLKGITEYYAYVTERYKVCAILFYCLILYFVGALPQYPIFQTSNSTSYYILQYCTTR